MHACKCGNFGSYSNECTCTQRSIENYLSKVSGPVLDRIDLHIEVNPVKYSDLENDNRNTETSKQIRERVNKARNIQIKRYKKDNIFSNSQLSSNNINKYCKLDSASKEILKTAFDNLGFSARVYNKILKVARTIADLEESSNIKESHIAEAIQYRSLDRKYW